MFVRSIGRISRLRCVMVRGNSRGMMVGGRFMIGRLFISRFMVRGGFMIRGGLMIGRLRVVRLRVSISRLMVGLRVTISWLMMGLGVPIMRVGVVGVMRVLFLFGVDEGVQIGIQVEVIVAGLGFAVYVVPVITVESFLVE